MGDNVYKQAQDSAIIRGLQGCLIGTPIGAGVGAALGAAGTPAGALTGGLIGAASGCIVGAAKEMLSGGQTDLYSAPRIPTDLGDSRSGPAL